MNKFNATVKFKNGRIDHYNSVKVDQDTDKRFLTLYGNNTIIIINKDEIITATLEEDTPRYNLKYSLSNTDAQH